MNKTRKLCETNIKFKQSIGLLKPIVTLCTVVYFNSFSLFAPYYCIVIIDIPQIDLLLIHGINY